MFKKIINGALMSCFLVSAYSSNAFAFCSAKAGSICRINPILGSDCCERLLTCVQSTSNPLMGTCKAQGSAGTGSNPTGPTLNGPALPGSGLGRRQTSPSKR
jgi:hypothetical protein